VVLFHAALFEAYILCAVLCRFGCDYECGEKEFFSMDLLQAVAQQHIKTDLPRLKIGDTVKVHVKIKEGARERVQIFEGTIIAMKHGGINESITVRRISYGVGAEKVFPIHAPNVAKIEVVRHGKARRAKLYFLRGRVGKRARLKQDI